MDKIGINGVALSHNRCMEQLQSSSVTLSQKEAEEYCAYKRQKKISEITSAMRRAESVLTGNEDVARTCERAARLKLAAVQLTPAGLLQWGELAGTRPVKIDCVVGGDGETLVKVKAYEIKQVLRLGAGEITARITPSLVSCSRYTRLRKEIRKLRKAAGKATLKIRIERILPSATLSRLLRICCEAGANYFSFPYFEGCERFQNELLGGCQLEVSGVDTLPVFQKMAGAGIGRTITSRAWEVYCEWVQEVEKVAVCEVKKTTALPPVSTSAALSKTAAQSEEKTPLLPSRVEHAG